MKISADFSQIDKLEQVLETARAKPYKERVKALDNVARQVATDARGIVAGYDKASTGELEGAIEIAGTPASRTIGADVRQAWFLEVGSPKTGAPRPWLTGPARKGAEELLSELGEIGRIW